MVASWAEFDGILQVIGCKVGIAYGHGQGGMRRLPSFTVGTTPFMAQARAVP